MGLSLNSEMRALPISLSESEQIYYTDVFERFGGNRGSISASEIGKVVKSLGEEISNDQLKELVNEVDLNKNTKIEVDEFLKVSKHRVLCDTRTKRS